MNTWAKAKKEWYVGQRAQCADLQSDKQKENQWGTFLIDEKNCALLGPWFDRLIESQKHGANK